jgi:hypothetical protein
MGDFGMGWSREKHAAYEEAQRKGRSAQNLRLVFVAFSAVVFMSALTFYVMRVRIAIADIKKLLTLSERYKSYQCRLYNRNSVGFGSSARENIQSNRTTMNSLIVKVMRAKEVVQLVIARVITRTMKET